MNALQAFTKLNLRTLPFMSTTDAVLDGIQGTSSNDNHTHTHTHARTHARTHTHTHTRSHISTLAFMHHDIQGTSNPH